MDQHWTQFVEALLEATELLEGRYFQLAVAGQMRPAVRERAYCYELYHQLRLALPDEADFPFALHGEVDKRGHPLLDQVLGGLNPDLIVHTPGQQGPNSNLAIVEVKACGAFGNPVTKDADSLTAFIEQAAYFKGAALIFGGDRAGLERHIRTVFPNARHLHDRIAIYWHSQVGQPAEVIDWAQLFDHNVAAG
jgi:hypothetical protein